MGFAGDGRADWLVRLLSISCNGGNHLGFGQDVTQSFVSPSPPSSAPPAAAPAPPLQVVVSGSPAYCYALATWKPQYRSARWPCRRTQRTTHGMVGEIRYASSRFEFPGGLPPGCREPVGIVSTSHPSGRRSGRYRGRSPPS